LEKRTRSQRLRDPNFWKKEHDPRSQQLRHLSNCAISTVARFQFLEKRTRSQRLRHPSGCAIPIFLEKKNTISAVAPSQRLRDPNFFGKKEHDLSGCAIPIFLEKKNTISAVAPSQQLRHLNGRAIPIFGKKEHDPPSQRLRDPNFFGKKNTIRDPNFWKKEGRSW
jgi:hypothetical protein